MAVERLLAARVLRERSMFSATRATIVVSQPPRFSTSLGVGAADPQPGVLDRVVGLGQRAQHPVGHRPQPGPMLLEPLGQPLLIGHVTFLRRQVS